MLSVARLSSPGPGSPITDIALSTAREGRMRYLAANVVVYWEAQPAERVLLVKSGVLKLYKLTTDGRRQLTGFAYPGDFLGLANQAGYIHTVETVTPATLRQFARGEVTRLVEEEPQVARLLLTAVVNDLVLAQDHLLLLGRKTAMERLAWFLVTLSERCRAQGGDPLEINLPMVRADIADYLGLTTETVSRTVTQLRKLGVIALRSAHDIRLIDVKRLTELGGRQATASVH